MQPLRTYDYLTIARGMLLDRVRTLTPEQYRSEHPIGLGSVARTLHHARGAEWFYVQRIRGERGPIVAATPECEPEISHQDAMPFDQLEPSWRRQADETRIAIESVTDWTTPLRRETTWEGRRYAYDASPADAFTQLALHEVHHRAQVMHMLRRMDVETDELDFNALMWTMTEVR